ncbi:MAG TPA: hypothetical protein DDZ53_07725 [Firmicutes bacterium]|nr:hypothetical protein [Bacillota bacterium]
MTRRNKLVCLLILMVLALVACRTVPQPAPQAELPTAIKLGIGEPKAISIDGSTLLVVRTLEEKNEGWLVATDGSTSKKIFEFTSTTFNAAFSPDGKYLAWATDTMWLANADGSEQRSLFASEAGIGPLTWSPSGQEIAFVESDSINITDLDGQKRTIAEAPESVRRLGWSTSPQGDERVFFNSFPAEAPAFVGSMTPEGADRRRLAEAEFFAVKGEQLFLSDPFEQGRLWVVNATDGSEPRVLVTTQVQDFTPRPGSSGQVVVLRQTGELQYELWLVSVVGDMQQQLTKGSPVIGPLWSPDGRSLYYGAFDLEATEEIADPFEVMKIELP